MAVERIVPGGEGWNELIGEHKSRYLFAAQYVRGKRVLDAGCGVGYGTRMLVDAGASEAVGVDISDEALTFARQHFSHQLITYTKDDCQTLTRVQPPFDVVVAFESLEHVADAAALVRRASELLTSSGVFIVSTPNKLLSPQGVNPFHVREFTPDEFRDLLSNNFSGIAMMGHRWTAAFTGVYRLWWNPVIRIGRLVQRLLRQDPSSVLPTEADFVITDSYPATAATLFAVCEGPRVGK